MNSQKLIAFFTIKTMATIEQVKELREITGVSISKCKEALEQSNGDMNAAKDLLRKWGQNVAEKKMSRVANKGIIDSYIHFNKQVGVLLDLRCETDFVARNPEFVELAHALCLHIAVMKPQYIKPEDIPAEIVDKEKAFYTEEFAKSGKPQNIIDKMMEGKLNKFYEERCLIKQPMMNEDGKTVEQYMIEKIQRIGENLLIHRFERFDIV